MKSAVLGTGFAVAGVLWFLAAARLLPPAQWLVWPGPMHALTLEQLLFYFSMLPRLAMALLVGAMLGLAGGLMQAVLRNPLADPTTLGSASGAQLAIVAVTLYAPAVLSFAGVFPVALAGAGLTTGLVLVLGARRDFAPVTVTIAGMLAGLLASAIATAMTLAQGHYLLSLIMWNGGALTQMDWSGTQRMVVALALGLLLAAMLARPLLVLGLGGASAQGLGLRVAPLRAGVLLLAVALSALVSAEVGLVGFVGLAAPALIRALGVQGLRAQLLAAPVAGAMLLALVDSLLLLVDTLGGPALPAGALTGLIGGPLLIWLLSRLRTTVPPRSEGAAHPAARAHAPRRIISALAVALIVLTSAVVLLGRGPYGWGFAPAEFIVHFVPLRATAGLAALAAGALLASAGACLQRLSANPMAAPEVLGVTGGAALGYAIAVFVHDGAGPLTLGIGAGMGGAAALMLLAALALRHDMAPVRVLLSGLAIGAFASAVLGGIMASDDRRAWLIMGWMAGSAGQTTPAGAAGLAVLAVAVLALLLVCARWLDILPLGAAVARMLGVPVVAVQLGLIVLAGLATGAATLIVGPVSFVGLMAPHLARSLGLVQARHFVAGSWLIGAGLMTLAAFGARTASYPYDLPMGLFATLIGAPWLFVHLMRRTRG